MPRRAGHVCGMPGCGALVRAPGGLCLVHGAARPARARAAGDRARGSAHARGYTSRWTKTARAFLAAHPWCARCGAPAVHVDHVVPHRGDSGLMWASGNWQGLCKACHDRKTWAERRLAVAERCVVLVAGPPAGGKKTWVQGQFRPGDVVVDLDALVGALTLGDWYGPGREGVLGLALAAWQYLVAAVRAEQHGGTAWVVTAAPLREARRIGEELGARVVVVDPGEAVARKQAGGDVRRRDGAGWGRIIGEWYASAE